MYNYFKIFLKNTRQYNTKQSIMYVNGKWLVHKLHLLIYYVCVYI